MEDRAKVQGCRDPRCIAAIPWAERILFSREGKWKRVRIQGHLVEGKLGLTVCR